jgi:DNA-binding LacI/PurR family transcriptional regulator
LVTITEVAKKAGVSPTTASYALNGRAGVKEETRIRILEVAKELHYVPDRLAQSFRNGRSNAITVITNEAIESENTFTGEFFGVLAEARTHHYDVLVKLVDNTEMSDHQIQALFRNRISDGFLLLGNLPDKYLQSFVESQACGVLLSAHSNHSIVQLNCNGRKGIADITRMALQKGKKKPAYLAYANITIEEELRRQGFKDAMKQAGLAGDDTYICGTAISDISECIDACIKKETDCFICWNDILAYTVIDILKHKKIIVPEQIAVTGFDDIMPTARENILTTVHQPFLDKGRKAMKLLLDQINNEMSDITEHYIDCQIVTRKSL